MTRSRRVQRRAVSKLAKIFAMISARLNTKEAVEFVQTDTSVRIYIDNNSRHDVREVWFDGFGYLGGVELDLSYVSHLMGLGLDRDLFVVRIEEDLNPSEQEEGEAIVHREFLAAINSITIGESNAS